MRPRHHRSFVSALALALSGTLVAAAEVKPILEMNELRFAVGSVEGRWLLTVSGPDGYYRRQEFRGVDPTIPLFTDETKVLADGSYVWELRPLNLEVPDRAAVRSGQFRVRSGAAVLPDDSALEEVAVPRPRSRAEGGPIDAGLGDPIPPAVDHAGDFYIGEDFVFGTGPGRLAFGGEIDGTESFGFASMLVEAENIRLKFNDVSVLAGFPTRSWQITMNDSSSAGAEYFRIEDLDAATQPFRIDAGAASDSLRIDQNGNVGIGTATPGVRLRVAGDATIDGDFTVLSSRAAKTDFSAVDVAEVLSRLAELPLVEWSHPGRAARHLGPVSEEFFAVFGLGRDERAINPLDLGGVALAAIQGLRARVDELAAREARGRALLAERERDLALLAGDRDALRRRVELLERQVGALIDALAEDAGSR